ncbi:Alpha/Beta hydrolase protein [Dendryphion nanum]|uniref:Carboxylic ester hydrolase n=1 Tax=Dendryphion nanum TaxID=256645 RepID=A0A9P9ICQ7_9PLEO|nr:Alpha/Beta hydrolase protein [Dendryphion nanum]
MHLRLSRLVNIGLVLVLSATGVSANPATVVDRAKDVIYKGFERNGVEVFLGIPYGQDTSGVNRFRPPRPFINRPGTVVNATIAGPACPQSLGLWFPPLTLNNITEISEDCLNLNIVRPVSNDRARTSHKLLPVMVWIHGGSFWAGSNMEPTHNPDGLVLEAIKDNADHAVIHVAMNYRLGFFGFAQSGSLQEEGSLNAGLRDQRLAIEWVRDNILSFGGNPSNITIFGQSSGGLAVGMHLLAYGGTKPLPFQQGICQSQALEPGLTGNFTINAMHALVDYIGCNTTSFNSPETIACLRQFDTKSVLKASLDTYVGDIAHNIGDIWMPTVDGDFVPETPSKLVKEGRFGKTTSGQPAKYMIGWTDGDVNFFTDVSIETSNDTHNFLQAYLPNAPSHAIDQLTSLYPVSEFAPPQGTNLTAEFYRTARVFRDIIMTCQPIFLAENIKKYGGDVYLYDFNQTLIEPSIEAEYNVSHIGVIHTSEFPYIYANLTFYSEAKPTQADEDLKCRASNSWSSFAASGHPSGSENAYTLKGWKDAFYDIDNINIFVIGGSKNGLAAIDGPNSTPEMSGQRLRERCALINSEKWIEYLQY